jgi:hypothetical protein
MTQAHESPSDQERAQKKEERRGTVPVRMPRDYRAEPERDSAESERQVDQPPTDDDYSDCEQDERELVQAMVRPDNGSPGQKDGAESGDVHAILLPPFAADRPSRTRNRLLATALAGKPPLDFDCRLGAEAPSTTRANANRLGVGVVVAAHAQII